MSMNVSEHTFICVKLFNTKLLYTVHSIEVLYVGFYNTVLCEDGNRCLKKTNYFI